MQIKNIPASRAVDWFKQGWAIFSQDRVTWVLMTLIIGVGSLVLSMLPIIGQIILLVLMPALVGGLLYAAKQASMGKPIKIEYLWVVLTDVRKRNEFLALGGILFALAMLVMIISVVFVGDSLLRGATSGVASFGLGSLLFLLIMGFASFVLFNYTPALMLFRDMSLFDALKTCARTASAQAVPLLVMFLIYMVLSFVAAIPFGLGFLVLLPVTIAAVYTGFEEIF